MVRVLAMDLLANSLSRKAKLRELRTSTDALTAGALPWRGSSALPVSWDDQVFQQG